MKIHKKFLERFPVELKAHKEQIMNQGEREKSLQRLSIARRMLERNLKEAEAREQLEDEIRIKKGLEPKYKNTPEKQERLNEIFDLIPEDLEPIAANFYPADPRPPIEKCISKLETDCRTTAASSKKIKSDLRVLDEVETMVVHDESFSDKHGGDEKLSKSKKLKENKPTYLGYALLHYYWYKFTGDKSFELNENSYRRLAEKYQINDTQLWKYARPMLEDEPKPSRSHISKKEYGEQYKLILPLLAEACTPAFDEVTNKLAKLKKDNPTLNI